MSQLPSTFFKIEPLGPNNWYPWKWRILAFLSERKLTGFVDGKIKEPVELEDKPAYDDWVDKNRSAMTTLELAISDKELAHLNGTRTTAEMWKSLLEVKESSGLMGILRARQNLFQTKCNETTLLPTHIVTLKRYREDLSDLQKPVADDDFAMIILGSLPNSWEPFIEAFLGSHTGEKVSISSQGLIKVLFDEEKRRNLRSNAEVILVSQNRKGS